MEAKEAGDRPRDRRGIKARYKGQVVEVDQDVAAALKGRCIWCWCPLLKLRKERRMLCVVCKEGLATRLKQKDHERYMAQRKQRREKKKEHYWSDPAARAVEKHDYLRRKREAAEVALVERWRRLQRGE